MHHTTLAAGLQDQPDQPAPDAVPHDRPDTSLWSELLGKLAIQREVILDLCDRVERLEMRADGLTAMERVERRWAKEKAGGDKLDRLIAQDREADELAVPGSQRLATHPDGTPMISIGKAEDLNTIARLAADPEHARAVLADEPAVPDDREPAALVGEPTDAELLGLMPEQFRTDLATVSRLAAHNAGTGVTAGLFRVSLNTGALEYARAVLARWGRQPSPLAVGEMGELADRLGRIADGVRDMGWEQDAGTISRAADLLEQRHPEPVPVSERLPGPEDCNEMGQCWWFDAELWCLDIYDHEYTHWLSYPSLPLPDQK